MVNKVFCALNYLAIKIASTLSKRGSYRKKRLAIEMKFLVASLFR